MNWLLEIAAQTWALVAEVAPWLLLGFALAGLISVVLDRALVERILGRPGIGSIFKATLVGVPMPLCSCGVIPVAAAIREHGASRGATAAFLASTPQTGVDSIAATWGLLGPFLAWVRVAVAFVSGILAGLLVQWVSRERVAATKAEAGDAHSSCTHGGGNTKACTGQGKPKDCCAHEHEAAVEVAVEDDACCGQCAADGGDAPAGKPMGEGEVAETSCCSSGANDGGCCGHGGDAAHHAEPQAAGSLAAKLGRAARYGFVTLPADMVLSLSFGLLLAGVLAALLPAGLLADLGLTGWMSYLAVTALSVPFYVCSTGSIPFAYVLLQAGLSPGGVLVFLVAGPATNVATLTTMRRYLGLRGIGAYLLAIVGTAWAAGALIDAGLGKQAVLSHIHEHVMEPSLIQQTSGVALLVMLAYAAWKRFGR